MKCVMMLSLHKLLVHFLVKLKCRLLFDMNPLLLKRLEMLKNNYNIIKMILTAGITSYLKKCFVNAQPYHKNALYWLVYSKHDISNKNYLETGSHHLKIVIYWTQIYHLSIAKVYGEYIIVIPKYKRQQDAMCDILLIVFDDRHMESRHDLYLYSDLTLIFETILDQSRYKDLTNTFFKISQTILICAQNSNIFLT